MDFSGRVIHSILIFVIFLLMTSASSQTVTYPAKSDSLDKSVPPIKTYSFIDKFKAPDKAQHFMGSLISTILIYKICREPLDFQDRNSKIFSAGITLGLGISKEIYDHSRTRGMFSWRDLLADLAGIGVGFILINQP